VLLVSDVLDGGGCDAAVRTGTCLTTVVSSGSGCFIVELELLVAPDNNGNKEQEEAEEGDEGEGLEDPIVAANKEEAGIVGMGIDMVVDEPILDGCEAAVRLISRITQR